MLLEGVAAVVLITVYDGTTTARIMIITIVDIRIKYYLLIPVNDPWALCPCPTIFTAATLT